MSDDSPLDPATGLLHRTAFLKEVRKAQSTVPADRRRGCLLILHFPGLLKIAEQHGKQAADQTLLKLLAIVESRLRSRDTLGRIAMHSLCLILRQCRESDALIIADQYGALLSDGALDDRLVDAVTAMHYRIVPLDPRGHRPRLGLSKVVSSTALGETSKLLSTISSFNIKEEPATDNVVSLSAESTDSVADNRDTTHANNNTGSLIGRLPGPDTLTQLTAQAWRLKPGLLLNHKLLVCCHRVQSVGSAPVAEPLSSSAIINAALDCLALDQKNARPVIETQLIIPVEATLLTNDAADWLKDRCRSQRVAPSDICLAMTVDSVSRNPRQCMPTLRRLNRQGIRLMLEGVNAAPQFSALLKLAAFDYLWVSARTLQGSMHDIRQRRELDSLIIEAHTQHREVCASGVDTEALLLHAQQLQIDIGFGRRCGKSEPFPDRAKISAHPGR